MNSTAEKLKVARQIRVRGLVQGVGFRPTVWRLAKALGLRGEVCNDGAGVLIHAYASPERLSRFCEALRAQCPPLARIDSIEQSAFDSPLTYDDFLITRSEHSVASTGVVPDAATCPDCLGELNDPSDRRFGYAFTNCTHCGPRLSIVRGIPYDRAATTMAEFELCDTCRREYENAADRRFHAQPNACPACGPQVWLSDNAGIRLTTDRPVRLAAKRIAAGDIVAIKGIGGFHLACDATNPVALAKLRQRKRRPHKPLALMARDLDQIGRYCHVCPVEADALLSPAAPIVVLQARDPNRLPEAIAPDQRQWGFMLPYSPLHHLLMNELAQPIVLTSGNRSEEPQCIDNDDALHRLGDIADVFLLHNRAIANRIDDSVIRRMGDDLQTLRRARGYAPGHIPLPEGFSGHPELLALGGELKNAFCMLHNGHAILSQHMGDLEDARTYAEYQHNIALYQDLFQHRPGALAVDQHPEYLSSKLGRTWAEERHLPLLEVQHHHAHIAACMADNGLPMHSEAVIGIALDGLGFGSDGTLWGGEFLLADYRVFRRLAHLRPIALPGAAQAMREPWRNTYAQLLTCLGKTALERQTAGLALAGYFATKPVQALGQMIDGGINAPLSSSAGRLFDAVAGAIGLWPDRVSFEGQAAMALEACLDDDRTGVEAPYRFDASRQNGIWQLNPTPLWEALLDDLHRRQSAATMAARFHHGFADALTHIAVQLRADTSCNTVALSGGVMQNRALFERTRTGLIERGFNVISHHQVPANDGGIALGQAVIAAARLLD